MSWNYRVTITRTEHGDLYEIREVYYHDDGSMRATTVDAMEPFGETLDELKTNFKMMSRAFDLPVVDVTGDKLEELPPTPPGL